MEKNPSANKKLPILDLQCWMEKIHITNQVYYEFYRKPMSNRQLMMSQSAMPEKVKRITLTQETIRILRNCHLDLPWKDKFVHLNEFTERMRERSDGIGIEGLPEDDECTTKWRETSQQAQERGSIREKERKDEKKNEVVEERSL